ncbi:acyl-CoA synthetase [Catelliglobosispora koreensis]|uniref:acyl-CoA synthetase n=1 Tax=Catelliglobosispora koreensis TaxID=129052 RepID=UPI000378CA2E|nr:acyl-CoA synthetase [Catelliglobosispora koreensis]
MALNIADLYEHAADLFPDRIAVACGDRTVTFAELDERSNRLAHHLAGHGVGAGMHIGLYVRNSIEAMEALLATYKLRAVAINVNYRYVENELRYVFTDADVVALIHDEQFAPLVANVLPEVAPMRCVVSIGAGYEDLLAVQSPERNFEPRSNDDLYILYTGGTTGKPKGVMWRHEDVWRVLGGGIDFISGEPMEDEWSQSKRGVETGGMVRMCIAPLIHGNAQWGALMALFAGDTVVLVPQFDPHEVWRSIERHGVNVVVLIGDAMARPIIEAFIEGSYDASSLWAVSSSASLFSPSVKEQYIEHLPSIMLTESIGSSETGFTGIGFVTAETKDDGPRVNPGPNTIVIDDDNRPVGPGVIGRMARGGHVPIGYYKDPEKTRALLVEVDGKRYSVPGDFARIEEDGRMTLLGRGNTCVNTGGEKVFPEEVEGALKSHPAVLDAIVIGLPDERLGQRVAALVQPRPEHTVELSELEAHVRTQVAGYKVPRTVWVVDEISRTVSGKADYGWAKRYAEERAAA